jgi:hypothetical protein
LIGGAGKPTIESSAADNFIIREPSIIKELFRGVGLCDGFMALLIALQF